MAKTPIPNRAALRVAGLYLPSKTDALVSVGEVVRITGLNDGLVAQLCKDGTFRGVQIQGKGTKRVRRMIPASEAARVAVALEEQWAAQRALEQETAPQAEPTMRDLWALLHETRRAVSTLEAQVRVFRSES